MTDVYIADMKNESHKENRTYTDSQFICAHLLNTLTHSLVQQGQII
jgi:hypothetical protein